MSHERVSPGKVVADIAIDAPYPRTQEFRTCALYNKYCREVSQHLAQAIGVGVW